MFLYVFLNKTPFMFINYFESDKGKVKSDSDIMP